MKRTEDGQDDPHNSVAILDLANGVLNKISHTSTVLNEMQRVIEQFMTTLLPDPLSSQSPASARSKGDFDKTSPPPAIVNCSDSMRSLYPSLDPLYARVFKTIPTDLPNACVLGLYLMSMCAQRKHINTIKEIKNVLMSFLRHSHEPPVAADVQNYIHQLQQFTTPEFAKKKHWMVKRFLILAFKWKEADVPTIGPPSARRSRLKAVPGSQQQLVLPQNASTTPHLSSS